MTRLIVCLLLFPALSALTIDDAHSQSMNNQKLYQILEGTVDSLEGRSGAWQFLYGDRLMILLTDEHHNRMRVITPIMTVDEVSDQQMQEALTANFHTALDAKYAISDELVWSVFMHPLSSLSEDQFLDALLQVYRAAVTFGTTYSSSELIFPGSQPPAEDKNPVRKM